MTARALGRTGEGFAPTILIMAMDTPPWERRRLAGMRAKRARTQMPASPPPPREGRLAPRGGRDRSVASLYATMRIAGFAQRASA